MTFKQSILLDILLKDFMIPGYIGNGSLVAITLVTNGNKKLVKLSEIEIIELLNLIKSHYIKTGIPLIQGEFGFIVYKENISIFLKNGGFKKIFIINLIKKIFIYIIPLITFLILFWSEFIKESGLLEEKIFEENTQQTKTKFKDTLKTKKIDLKNLNKKE